jgi:hypothetical protein
LEGARFPFPALSGLGSKIGTERYIVLSSNPNLQLSKCRNGEKIGD